MEETKVAIAEKIALSKAWLCEISAIGSLAASYSLHEVNEILQTVAIIVSILGGIAAMWNSIKRKK